MPEPPALRLHPRLADLYRKKIDDLVSALSDPSVKLGAMEALRGLVSEIRIIPDSDAPSGHRMELVGELAAILALSESAGAVSGCRGLDMQKPPRLARAGVDHVWSGTLVAGVGFEPTTFRL